MRLVDGKAIAAAINTETAAAAAALRDSGTTPTLVVVVPTEDESTAWYVRSIQRAATKLGIQCNVEQITDATGPQIVQVLARLSADPSVHGIICQTPLPTGVAPHQVTSAIDPGKDVDGANPFSLGRLASGVPTFAPATAAAVLEILRREQVVLEGKNVVIVGRSTVVGKPAALLLLHENATVTVCHSRTTGLAEVCARADVLVAAVGRPRMIGAAHVQPGAVIIDVGTNPTPDGGLVGDVDQGAVGDRASLLTPVPGGVGPVTTALLLRHVVQAASAVVAAV